METNDSKALSSAASCEELHQVRETNPFRRRAAIAVGLGISAAAVIRPRSAYATTSTAEQNVLTHGADPTGSADSTAAFNACFTALPSSGGSIYVPGGIYKLNSALSFTNKSLTLFGDGSAASLLMMNHTGVAITFTGTSSYPSVTPFQLLGIGISGPSSGSAAAGAISIVFPVDQSDSGYQYCFVDDVTIGVAQVNASNGCNITTGLSLTNIWKSQFNNVRMFGPFGSGTFVSLNGTLNIDNWFTNCVADGPYYGFSISSVCQGLRIIQPLVITQVGFTCNYNVTNDGINILGLYISGGEISAGIKAADIYQVNQAYISDTHFACSNASAAAVVSLENCVAVRMSNLVIAGAYSSSNGSATYGMNLGGALCQLNGALFSNLGPGRGVQFTSGAAANSAFGLQLVNQNVYPQLQSNNAAVDNSGITGSGVNNAQWQINNGQYVSLH